MITWTDIVRAANTGSFDPADIDDVRYVRDGMFRLQTVHSYADGGIIDIYVGESAEGVVISDEAMTICEILNLGTVEIDDPHLSSKIQEIYRKHGVTRKGGIFLIQLASIEQLNSGIKSLIAACKEIYEFVYDIGGFERVKD
jgi:hypothetical protein